MSKIIIALDYNDDKHALSFIESIDPALAKIKIGKGMFTRFGPGLVKAIINKGFDVFLDLKFHDIPYTVADACRAAADLGAWMITVHACGGFKMLQAAKEALNQSGNKPKLIAVTILTSMTMPDLNEIGITLPIKDHVLRLAQLAHEAELDGVVCSAEEALLLRKTLGKEFCLVTPGIRLAGSNANDQKRVVTPETAIAQGSDYLVIGRPITQAADPKVALDNILKHLS